MNAAQIHLALNHVPLFFSIVGGLLLSYSLVKKNESLMSVCFYMLITGALFTIPVFLTGHGTEELVEDTAGISEGLIDEHEEMARISLWIISLTGVIALAALITRRRKNVAKGLVLATIALSLISFGTMAQTAHLGGQIRHSEIGKAVAIGKEAEKAEQKQNKEGDQRVDGNKEKDDDD